MFAAFGLSTLSTQRRQMRLGQLIIGFCKKFSRNYEWLKTFRIAYLCARVLAMKKSIEERFLREKLLHFLIFN